MLTVEMIFTESTSFDLAFHHVDPSLDEAPIVSMINQVLLAAIQCGASDIHFEPYENSYRIRLRQDGILSEYTTVAFHLAPRLVVRLKVMSCLDISERRVPQDGRFKMTLNNQTMDFRVSTCPTLFGEKVVLRLLDAKVAKIGIDQLGFEEAQKSAFLQALHRSQGMILVTGPTGSGKTVSLYSALNLLNTSAVNISTIEDPVEIYLPGINQVNINPKVGLSFATTLRAFLRQDPDIIMIGEIRDRKTASIAIKAAQTGHLVLSTLHTNGAPQTIIRLLNMGIAPFNLVPALSLVIAQRLVRKLCPHCKQTIEYASSSLIKMGFDCPPSEKWTFYQGRGCQQCYQGFKGQIGLYEVMPISPTLAQLIMQNADINLINMQMKKEGWISLRQAGFNKAVLGITSLEEVNRVTHD